MNNNIIKKEYDKEENEKDLKILENFFELEDSEIINVERKKEVEYVEEKDEIDGQGYLIKAKNVNLKLIEEHYEIHVKKKNNEYGTCPCCGQMVTRVHDYYDRMIQDVTFRGIPIFFRYEVKRFYCVDCIKSFTEENKDFPKGIKTTINLVANIINALKENVSRATIARENHVSTYFVKTILDTCAFKRKELGKAICIDEFKGNMKMKVKEEWITRKYQTLIRHPENGEIIDILPTRDNWYLIQYFSKLPIEQRKKVKYFICDMNAYFIKIGKAYFPNAKIVIDRFHYTEVIVEAFEKIRKEVQNRQSEKDRKTFKRSRYLLLMHEEKLKETKGGTEQVERMLEKSIGLKKGYEMLQEFYKLNKIVGRAEARIKLKMYYEKVEKSKLNTFKKAIETIRRHERDILNSFETKYTNAYAEGMNNLIKVIKRVSYGLKNLERFKKRLELIVNNYREIREKNKKHKEIRQEILRERKRYRNEIKAAIQEAA